MSTVPDSAEHALQALSEDQLRELHQNLNRLIEVRTASIEYAETRRSAFVALAGALVAASVALLTLTITSIEGGAAYVGLIALSISGCLLALVIWVVYALQTNFKYPFVKAAQTWKWFYWYALPDPQEFTAPWYALQRQASFEQGKHAYTQQWGRFWRQQIPGLTNPMQSALQDLEQVYLLHVNERYKNLFLTHLRRIFFYGILGVAIVTAGGFVIGAFLPASFPVSSGEYANKEVTVRASWRETGNTRRTGVGEESQILVNLRIANKAKNDIAVQRFIPVDDSGMKVSHFLQSTRPAPLIVPAGHSVDATAIMWFPTPLQTQLERIEVHW